MEFFADIENGRLKNVIPIADGRYYVSIKKKTTRSTSQNRYWWGGVLPLVKRGLNDIGYHEVKTNEDAHEVIKALFLKKYIDNGTETALEMSGSTTELTTTEFNDLIANVQMWAVEFLNIEIPDPNSQLVLL